MSSQRILSVMAGSTSVMPVVLSGRASQNQRTKFLGAEWASPGTPRPARYRGAVSRAAEAWIRDLSSMIPPCDGVGVQERDPENAGANTPLALGLCRP